MSSPNASSATGTIATAKAPAGSRRMRDPQPYVGRFAPSPTGPLHVGSLLAAVASYLEARRHGGRWLVRIDDIDPPREQPGASDSILTVLARYGFAWDGDVIYQSQSDTEQRAAVQRLRDSGQAYRCGCSRRDLEDAAQGPLGRIYPGTCRRGSDAKEAAIRVRTTNERVAFTDGLQGPQSLHLESDSGDFVILRRDGLVAYQIAVVVDDHLRGVTDIVRGIDLMPSTPRQIWLQRLLGLPTPRYAHIPVVVNAEGSKLSKLTGAAPLPINEPGPSLAHALRLLRQTPPEDLGSANVATIWQWATEHWDIRSLSGQREVHDTDRALGSTENPLR